MAAALAVGTAALGVAALGMAAAWVWLSSPAPVDLDEVRLGERTVVTPGHSADMTGLVVGLDVVGPQQGEGSGAASGDDPGPGPLLVARPPGGGQPCRFAAVAGERWTVDSGGGRWRVRVLAVVPAGPGRGSAGGPAVDVQVERLVGPVAGPGAGVEAEPSTQCRRG